jgi:hypothetical protein
MPRDKLLFKFVGEMNPDGTPAEFHSGIPARDLHESDRALLADEHLVTLAASPLYEARNEAGEIAAKAERRIDREAEAAPAPVAAGGMARPSSAPIAEAPKASEKK